jgi:general secretion pathway protein K
MSSDRRDWRGAKRRKGAALLAVLWLSAALSAIAFSVASTVRAETERTSTDVDSLRAGYLAEGGIYRALLYVIWGPNYRNPDGTPKYFQNPMPKLHFEFPTGVADVELIPETAKLNVNLALPVEIRNVLLAIGVAPARADAITAAIIDWRSPAPEGGSQFDQRYLSMVPSFRARHASLHEIEELLLVQGVTPDLFYGAYTRDEDGKLIRHAALRDCLSVFGTRSVLDVNTVEPEVMRAIGVTPDVIRAIVLRRKQAPLKTPGDLGPLLSAAGPLAARLGINPSVILTLRSTARVRLQDGKLGDLQHTTTAMVKFLTPDFDVPYHVLRWYDNVVAPQ